MATRFCEFFLELFCARNHVLGWFPVGYNLMIWTDPFAVTNSREIGDVRKESDAFTSEAENAVDFIIVLVIYFIV